MIRSILRSRQLLQSVRNFSENKTIPPDFIDPKKLSDVIDNAVTSDDRLSTGDQGLRNVDFIPFFIFLESGQHFGRCLLDQNLSKSRSLASLLRDDTYFGTKVFDDSNS